jgi:hypothetical protein
MTPQHIPADLVVDIALRRVQRCIEDARAAADLLRADQFDWLSAHYLIGTQQNAVDTVCWTLEALLDAAGLSASVARLAELRTTAQAALQALQSTLREQHLLDGPTARRAA